jgi:SAM-dependent methyltransferase
MKWPQCWSENLSDLDVATIEAGCRAVERLARLYLLRAFHDAGVFVRTGERATIDSLTRELSVTPKYERLFRVLLEMLTCDGDVSVSADAVTTHQVRDSGEAACAALRDEVLAVHPDRLHLIRLVDACATRALDVVAGRASAVEVLFPAGSSTLVEAVYAQDAVSGYFNGLSADAVEAALRAQRSARPGARLSVLEIGAGTGGTSIPVLERLASITGPLTYEYTDISPALLQAAQNGAAGAYPDVRFRVLNIEKDPAPQGFNADHDVVIAANVLHATRDIAVTLGHVKKLLRPGGQLVLSEVTRIYHFTTLTFGLMPGWWLFGDAGRLPDSPLLSVGGWTRALGAAGFDDVRCVTPFADRDQPAQALLLAVPVSHQTPFVGRVSPEDLIQRQLQLIEAQLAILTERTSRRTL